MLKGSFVALVTPMLNNGEIHYESLKKLVEFHIANQTDGIVLTGTSGESSTLNVEERTQLIRTTVEISENRIPIIVGTGSNSTSKAIELTERASEIGVDACLSVVPYYNKPTQNGIYLHFKNIANNVNVPLILYNVPSRTSLDMSNDTVVELSKIANIIGIKDATGDISRVSDLLKRCGSNFLIYSGEDSKTLDYIKAGGHGCISVTANIVPEKMRKMCSAAFDGNFKIANRINSELDDLHRMLFVETNPIPVKWAVSELGLIGQGIRLPLTKLSNKFHQPIREAMRKAGIV